MSWRTVVIANRCKLDYKLGYLVVRGEETRRVFADEIAILLIENPAVSLTGCLLSELAQRKVKVIFCDAKRNPQSELLPYYGSHDSSAKLKAQIRWPREVKGLVFTEIVSEKIRNQADFLEELGRADAAALLRSYLTQLEFYDATNREGHAAKVYFNAVFGMEFTRSAEICTNAALNYGYGLLLSAINREIAASGYRTELGLFHDNMFNHFNLSCDLMEPYRIFTDRLVYASRFTAFDTSEKHQMLALLHQTVWIDNTHQTLLNSVKIYVRSVFDALEEGDISKLKFPRGKG